MNNTTGVFYYSAALVLITFVSFYSGSCVNLPSAPGKSVIYKCNGKYSESCTFGRIVPEYTLVKTSCKPGYFSLNSDDGNETTSVCAENRWIPPHIKCHKTCDRLYPDQMNVHLECFHGNKSIPCEDDSLISGSRVRSSCKQAHKYENYKNTYQEINCGEDGKWDAALIPCISGCEKKPESHEAPWHVIIVHNNYEKGQSCFGTVVSPRLILTAESCLFLEVSITGSEGSDANATHYSVLVARYPDYQRFYEVAEFQYFNQTKFSNNWNRGLTPMIVVLKEKLEFNSFVSPAHIQWENQKKLDMWNGTVKVSATVELPSDLENDLTEILHTRPTTNSVNFSSHIACKERWTYPYFALYWAAKLKSYKETIDKTFLYDKNLMCLEFDEDSTLNIGSGVVVEDNNCNYFLRGIMGYPLDLAQLISRMNTHLGLNDGFSNNFNKFRKCANKRIPPKWSNVEESFKFWCNITNLVMKTTRKIGNKLENDPKIAGFLDIADYVGWIKKVRDEIENK